MMNYWSEGFIQVGVTFCSHVDKNVSSVGNSPYHLYQLLLHSEICINTMCQRAERPYDLRPYVMKQAYFFKRKCQENTFSSLVFKSFLNDFL